MIRIFAATLLLTAVSAMVVDDATLDHALESPQELLQIFNEFEEENHRGKSVEERTMRYREFKKHVKEISVHNHGHYSWKEGLNFFADMTDSERQSYLGLNVSNAMRNVVKMEKREMTEVPSRKSWIDAGAVTPVKDQASCGSCWAFGAMGTLEGVYKLGTGVLRNFAEQQMLDCSYADYEDGCGGGWMRDGVLSVKRDGQLASQRDYPYVASDGECLAKNKLNSMVGADVTDYVELEEGESYTIAALSQRPLAVTIKVIGSFYSYSSGIYRDETRTSFPNHALTAVAYTENYVLVKNSWSRTWGDQGFIKIARNYDGCSFHRFVGYAVLSNWRNDTNPSDRTTDYDPNDRPTPTISPTEEPCSDNFTGCSKKYCRYTLVKEVCPKTCGDCKEDECPAGTVRCDDGVCRHVHMC